MNATLKYGIPAAVLAGVAAVAALQILEIDK